MKLEIPNEFAGQLLDRSGKDIDDFQDWVVKAMAAGIGRDAIINTLVGSGWPATFVIWYVDCPPPVAENLKGSVLKGNTETILIPEGWFLMGDKDQSNAKRRRVFLDAYRIGKTPVTVGQFKAYCADKGPAFSTFQKPSWGWIDNHPMVRVSWQEARDFCLWAGGDLPTEAQWENAARGKDDFNYPWGNVWDEKRLQWKAKGTAPVSAHPSGASSYGCLDMSGNMWEWCADWFGQISNQEVRNPAGASSGEWRVLRGGPWDSHDLNDFRTARRRNRNPKYQFENHGFRIAGSP